MSKERLEKILNDLPSSIRHSGELESLKKYAREQAERYDECRLDAMKLYEENKRYREALIKVKLGSESDVIHYSTRLKSINKIAVEALEDES